jgi:hypothetical protein
MTLQTQEGEDKELREAVEYMQELRKDPKKFERWVDKVMDGWLKKSKTGKKNSSRLLSSSKRR